MTHTTLVPLLRTLDDVTHRCCGPRDGIISAGVHHDGPRLHLTWAAFLLAFDGEGEQSGRELRMVVDGVQVFAVEPIVDAETGAVVGSER